MTWLKDKLRITVREKTKRRVDNCSDDDDEFDDEGSTMAHSSSVSTETLPYYMLLAGGVNNKNSPPCGPPKHREVSMEYAPSPAEVCPTYEHTVPNFSQSLSIHLNTVGTTIQLHQELDVFDPQITDRTLREVFMQSRAFSLIMDAEFEAQVIWKYIDFLQLCVIFGLGKRCVNYEHLSSPDSKIAHLEQLRNTLLHNLKLHYQRVKSVASDTQFGREIITLWLGLLKRQFQIAAAIVHNDNPGYLEQSLQLSREAADIGCKLDQKNIGHPEDLGLRIELDLEPISEAVYNSQQDTLESEPPQSSTGPGTNNLNQPQAKPVATATPPPQESGNRADLNSPARMGEPYGQKPQCHGKLSLSTPKSMAPLVIYLNYTRRTSNGKHYIDIQPKVEGSRGPVSIVINEPTVVSAKLMIRVDSKDEDLAFQFTVDPSKISDNSRYSTKINASGVMYDLSFNVVRAGRSKFSVSDIVVSQTISGNAPAPRETKHDSAIRASKGGAATGDKPIRALEF